MAGKLEQQFERHTRAELVAGVVDNGLDRQSSAVGFDPAADATERSCVLSGGICQGNRFNRLSDFDQVGEAFGYPEFNNYARAIIYRHKLGLSIDEIAGIDGHEADNATNRGCYGATS